MKRGLRINDSSHEKRNTCEALEMVEMELNVADAGSEDGFGTEMVT